MRTKSKKTLSKITATKLATPTLRRGETSYIIEDMMNSVVARKDQIMTGIGTDNMTCILAYFKQGA